MPIFVQPAHESTTWIVQKMMQIVSENVSQWITPFLDNVAEEVFAVIDWEVGIFLFVCFFHQP